MSLTTLRFWIMATPVLALMGVVGAMAAPVPEGVKNAVKEPMRLHKLEISGPGRLAFVEDGKILIHAEGRTVRVWDVATGKEKLTWEKKEDKADWYVKDLAPDGTSVALLRGREDLRLFDPRTGKERRALAGEHDFYGLSNFFIYSPDGKLLVADYFGKPAYSVRIWDAVTGKEQEPLTGMKQGIVRSMAVSHDDKYLAIGCNGTDVLLYDLHKRELLRGFGEERVPQAEDRRGLSSPSRIVAITAVAFSPDGKTMAAGDNDGTVTLYEAGTGKKKNSLGDGPKSLKDFTVPCIGQLVFSRDGTTLLALDSYLAGKGDRRLHVWDVAAAKERPPLKLEGAVHFVALSPNGKQLAVVMAGEGKAAWVEVWEVPSLVKEKP
jgi:WD40 repeat protein